MKSGRIIDDGFQNDFWWYDPKWTRRGLFLQNGHIGSNDAFGFKNMPKMISYENCLSLSGAFSVKNLLSYDVKVLLRLWIPLLDLDIEA